MHDKSIGNVLRQLDSDRKGLTGQAITRSLAKYGDNSIKQSKKTSILSRFLSQFADLMIVILLVSALISFVLAIVEGESDSYYEPIIIIAIVLANATLGTVQQVKADKALEKLTQLTAGTSKVVRDGQVVEIASSQLVVGDIIMLASGDVVPCDCRLLECNGVKTNESMLTGESLPQEKQCDKLLPTDIPLSNRNNCLYSGTYVVSGRCVAVAFAVGSNTEIGKIANMLDSKTAKTPLEHRLAQLSKTIGIVCLAVCAVVFVMGLVKGLKAMSPTDSIVDVFMSIFMTSVSLAVAAIPEGLPAVVAIVLARGVSRMASKGAIVKSLSAVETLGSASVICCDKTGTLTVGKMSLVSVVTAQGLCQVDNLDDSAKQALAYFSMCSDVTCNDNKYYGDPTEVAVVEYCHQSNIMYSNKRVFELPFNSTRKMMTVVVNINGSTYSITKGALDNMDSNSSFANQYRQLSSKGLRVLALSVKKVSPSFARSKVLEDNLNIIALIVLSDTLRTEARDSVNLARSAGISTVMITGDSINTAVEIASELGIYRKGDLALEGSKVQDMTIAQLAAIVDKVSVYARATPQDKLKIVEAFQSRGYVTAMTGDGVNDAPALKRADIGCAMGINGTDVAKEASNMILTDDNFSTIVDAVAEGRTVYDNIKKSVVYLLSCNIGEVLCVLICLIIWNATPLFAMQLLWVNLVTDGLPGLALGIDKADKDIMKMPPKSSNETFFSHGQGRAIAIYGVVFGIVTVIAYAIGKGYDTITANTMAFFVLSLSQLFYALEKSSQRSLFVAGLSPIMILCFVASVAMVGVVAFVPAIMSVFQLTYLTTVNYLWCVGLALVPLVVGELMILCRHIVSKYKK